MTSKRIEWLDAVRGIACLGVVFAHIAAQIPSIGINASGTGKINVWMFFILSGFFVMLPYADGKKFGLIDTIPFWIKRIFRVYPMFLATSLAVYFLGIISLKELIKQILLLHGAAHFWAVPVEMKWYIVAVPLMHIVTKLSKKKKVLSLMILTVLLSVLFPYTHCDENGIIAIYYMPVFIMGMQAALLLSKEKTKESYVYDFLAIIIVIAAIISIPGFRALIFKIPADSYLQNKYLYFGFAWLLFLFFSHNGKIIKGLLSKCRFLRWIGSISFSIYLIHYILLNYISFFKSNVVNMCVLVPVTSILLSAIFEMIIERPCNAFAKRISIKIKGLEGKQKVFLKKLSLPIFFVGMIFYLLVEYKAVIYRRVAREEAAAQAAFLEAQENALEFNPSIDKIHVSIKGLDKQYRFLFMADNQANFDSREDLGWFGTRESRVFRNANGVAASEHMDDWMDYANKNQYDMLLLGGDIIDFVSDENLTALHKNLSLLQMPYLYTYGNHDAYIAWENSFDDDNPDFRSLFIDGDFDFQSIDMGDFYIVSIKNVDADGNANISEEALAKYKEIIKYGKPVILCMHVPLVTEKTVNLFTSDLTNPKLYDSYDAGDLGTVNQARAMGEGCGYEPTDATKEFAGLLQREDSPVRLILAGHLHESWQADITKNTIQYVAPGAFNDGGAEIIVDGQ